MKMTWGDCKERIKTLIHANLQGAIELDAVARGGKRQVLAGTTVLLSCTEMQTH